MSETWFLTVQEWASLRGRGQVWACDLLWGMSVTQGTFWSLVHAEFWWLCRILKNASCWWELKLGPELCLSREGE